jgi:hypothetical protein
MASAAFVNCIASSVKAFDDAHLATVTHPSGSAGASVFAFSETQPLDGETFLGAFALALEVQCRIANMLLLPPSRLNVGFYVTGLSGPIGVACAIGNLLVLDEQKMRWAIGLASQAGGFRSTHGTDDRAFPSPPRYARRDRGGAAGGRRSRRDIRFARQCLQAVPCLDVRAQVGEGARYARVVLHVHIPWRSG